MNQYLIDTKYAARELINLITAEEKQIIELKYKLKSEHKTHDLLHRDFLKKELDRDENFTEGQYLSSFNKQAKFGHEVINPIADEISYLEASLNNKKHSINALSGALLQIAKQGISSIYGDLNNCPGGRIVKNGTVLKEVIWQGRNQSMHYEEEIRNSHTIYCFDKLGYSNISNISLAKEIINLLDWKSYEQYERDMLSLLN